jgi:F420-0:gamma-glutamyl ligase-like protein
MDNETNKTRMTKILQWTNIAFAVGLGVCVYMNMTIEGIGIFFTAMGLVMILGAIMDTGTLIFVMGSFYDMIKNPTYRQYYARFMNLTWGLLILTMGIAALIKVW